MKISRFGFKKQKNTRSNLPQTSRPGTLSADTSFPASSSLERLASRTQKKKARSGLDFVTVLFITRARASERRRASSLLSIRHNAGARDAVLRSHRHAFEATDGFANAFVRGVFVRDGATRLFVRSALRKKKLLRRRGKQVSRDGVANEKTRVAFANDAWFVTRNRSFAHESARTKQRNTRVVPCPPSPRSPRGWLWRRRRAPSP